jgi:tRNA A37 threonylcarbamoyladenosine dehydratase
VEATHDALLARLRNVLRRSHGYPRAVDAQGQTRKRIAKLGVRVLWVDQPTILPAAWQQNDPLQGLSCAGYGSSVNVTASMGFAAANLVIQQLLAHHPKN